MDLDKIKIHYSDTQEEHVTVVDIISLHAITLGRFVQENTNSTEMNLEMKRLSRRN